MAQVMSPPGSDDFRIRPYLQNPTPHSMLVTWFSWTDHPGRFHLEGRPAIVSTPRLMEVLDWTEANRRQAAAHPEWGQWLHEGRNYRHQVQLEDLHPDTRYTYTVTQGATRATATLTTAPSNTDWSRIRFIAMSDSETAPIGRVRRRAWPPGALAAGGVRPDPETSRWAGRFGHQDTGRGPVLQYCLTEDEGFGHNITIAAERDPDLLLFAGDLVQGGAYQPGWAEWFRHLAGPDSHPASSRPLVTAMGNWEPFGGADGGYRIDAVIKGRAAYRSYFTPFGNGTEAHRGNYHRLDYGPLTILTLDSTKGSLDDHPGHYPPEQQATGPGAEEIGTDTQCHYSSTDYIAAGGTDLSPFNPGSVQWSWARAQLSDARASDQIIVVQVHHAPYSSGQHGLPMNHAETTGQGGTPLRAYAPMFAEFGVAAVISGHSELFERSYVDLDGDGRGVNYYDVGVAGDDLRSERHALDEEGNTSLLGANPYRVWTADQFEPEVWAKDRLVDGGKHYGHLEVTIERSELPGQGATMRLTPVYSFPLLSADLEVLGTERRTYADEVILGISADGTVIHDQAR